MSDQANPAEIEDVLSSIRRLVSGASDRTEDRSHEPKPPNEPDTAVAKGEPQHAEEDDALVLSPSQMISETAEANAGADMQDTPETHREWVDDALADSAVAAAADPEEIEGDAPPDADVDSGWTVIAGADDTGSAEAPLTDESSHPDEAEATHTGDAPEEAPTIEFEHRKSPFLSETLVARRAVERSTRGTMEEAPRSGFGFGAGRREDPTRHVPLSELDRPSAGTQRESGLPLERGLTLDVASDEQAERVLETGNFTLDAPAMDDEDQQESADAVLSPDSDQDSTPDEAANRGASEGAVTDEVELQGAALISSFMDDGRSTDLDSSVESSDATGVHTPSVGPPEADDDDPDDVAAEMISGDDETQLLSPETTEFDRGPATEADRDAVSGDDSRPEEPAERLGAPAVSPQGSASVHSENPADLQMAETAEPGTSAAPGTSDADRKPLNIFGPDSVSLDEETLRALIADVVHKELQGDLGERVSNNIRLLIRAEISRALDERGMS